MAFFDDMTEQEIRQNKAIRGYIVRALAKGNQNSLLVRQVTNALLADNLITVPDISKQLSYLEDGGYIEFTDKRATAYNAYRRDAVIQLTKAGVDLVEGTREDPGVDVYDALLANVAKNPEYEAVRYKGVISFATNTALWDAWERIFTDLENPKHKEDAEDFFKANEAEMLEGTAVLWEEKLPYYALMVMRVSEGEASFSSEIQNEPIDPENCAFAEEWFDFYDDGQLPPDFSDPKFLFVAANDPSLGKNRKSDTSAIIGIQWCITAIPIGIGLSIVVVWGLCAVMRQLSTVWFGYMPIFGISWLSIGVSIVLGLITVLLAARAPAKMAAKVSPLEAVTGNTQQESSFRHAANTRRWHVEVALGIHHAKAKRRSYILMTGAFAICITLFLGFCTLVPFMENAFMPKEWSPELSIVSDTNTCSIPADRRDAVAQNSAVSRVFGRMFAYDVPAQISGAIHNSNLISYEENQFRWAQDQLIAGSIDTVTNTPGQVLFVANTGTEVQVGDTITLTINGKDQTVTVLQKISGLYLCKCNGRTCQTKLHHTAFRDCIEKPRIEKNPFPRSPP